MFEVLLGYITGISDLVNSVIETIRGLVASVTGNAQEPSTEQSDEDVLMMRSIYNG